MWPHTWWGPSFFCSLWYLRMPTTSLGGFDVKVSLQFLLMSPLALLDTSIQSCSGAVVCFLVTWPSPPITEGVYSSRSRIKGLKIEQQEKILVNSWGIIWPGILTVQTRYLVNTVPPVWLRLSNKHHSCEHIAWLPSPYGVLRSVGSEHCPPIQCQVVCDDVGPALISRWWLSLISSIHSSRNNIDVTGERRREIKKPQTYKMDPPPANTAWIGKILHHSYSYTFVKIDILI